MNTKDTLHIYARVSTSAQEEQGTSLESQIEEGKKRAAVLGKKCKVWNEGGASSSGEHLLNRPKLTQLLQKVDDGEINHLYVWNTDRLSRNLETWGMIRMKLIRNDVRLHTPTGEQILSDPQTNLMLGIMSEISIYDNLLRRDRLVSGKVSKIKSGGWKGGPPPYGYQLQESKLVPDDYERGWVHSIFESYAARKSPDEIRSELLKSGVVTRRGNAVWSLGSIEKLLTNTHYGGYWTYTDKRSGETIRNECPAIISNRLIKKVNDQREKRAYKRPQSQRAKTNTQKHFYLLQGFLVCGECGSLYGGNRKVKQTSYYCCSGKALKYKRKGDDKVSPCQARRNIRIDTTDQVIWETVLETVSRSALFKETLKNETYTVPSKDTGKEKKRLTTRIKKLDREIDEIEVSIIEQETAKILRVVDKDRISAVIKNLEQHVLKCKSERENCYDDLANIEQGGKWINWIAKFGKQIKDLGDPNYPATDKRAFLEGVVEQITVQSVDTQSHTLNIKFRLPYVGDKLIWNNVKDKSKGYTLKSGRKDKKLKVNLLKKMVEK